MMPIVCLFNGSFRLSSENLSICRPSGGRASLPRRGSASPKASIAVFVVSTEAELLVVFLFDYLVRPGGALVARAIIIDDIAAARTLQLRAIAGQGPRPDRRELHVTVILSRPVLGGAAGGRNAAG